MNANLEKAHLTAATGLRRKLSDIAGEFDLPFYTALAEFCDHLGNPQITQASIIEAYQQIVGEARRLRGLTDTFTRLDEIVALIAGCGAPQWADRARNDLTDDDDRWTPPDWRAAWEWTRAEGYLRSLGDREGLHSLSNARVSAEAEQQRLFAEVVRVRTLREMKMALTPRVLSALAKFTTAIARLGLGTGRSAGRYRRLIRDAAFEAAQAVPCALDRSGDGQKPPGVAVGLTGAGRHRCRL